MSGAMHRRCADGVGCIEVINRLVAADKIEYVDGDVAAAAQLRATARRHAEIHGYGSRDPLEETA